MSLGATDARDSGSGSISLKRRIASSLGLVGVGGIFMHEAVSSYGTIWPVVAIASGVGLAGVAISQKSLLLQIPARAAAWLMFVPTAIATVVLAAASRHVEWQLLGTAAGTGASLLLSYPMLSTPEAKQSFAPIGYRKTFLASAVASAAAAITAGFASIATAEAGNVGWSLGLGLLATASAAAGVGVLRMRGWGVLLGIATSFATVLGAAIAAAVADPGAGLALLALAIPGIVMSMPLVLAKLGSGTEPSRVRVDAATMASDGAASAVRMRVADTGAQTDAEDDLATEVAAETARARASL